MPEQYSPLFPFIAAILLLLIAPLITKAAQHVLECHIDKDAKSSGVQSDATYPPSLHPSQVPHYMEYVSDFVQIIPGALLPIIGALLAVSTDVNTTTAIIITVVAVIAMVSLLLWVIITPPLVYAKKRRFGPHREGGVGPYSIVVVAAIVFNVVCIGIIAAPIYMANN